MNAFKDRGNSRPSIVQQRVGRLLVGKPRDKHVNDQLVAFAFIDSQRIWIERSGFQRLSKGRKQEENKNNTNCRPCCTHGSPRPLYPNDIQVVVYVGNYFLITFAAVLLN